GGPSANNDLVNGVVVQPDNKVVAVGSAEVTTRSQTTPGGPPTVAVTDVAVARLNVNGSLDTSFNNTGKLTFGYNLGGTNDDRADAVVLQGDKIVLAGTSNAQFLPSGPFFSPVSVDNLTVTRLNAGGTFDTSFNGSGKFNLALSRSGITFS